MVRLCAVALASQLYIFRPLSVASYTHNTYYVCCIVVHIIVGCVRCLPAKSILLSAQHVIVGRREKK